MAFSQEEIAMIVNSAMQQYVFNKIFEDHNGGKSFNLEAFTKKAQELSSDPLFNLSQEKQQAFADMMLNLDQFAGSTESRNNKNQLKLV